ncbi:MAG: hypothetical protein A3D39_00470 [Candidatus Buchananbacteria bacterium RIFCSPHIGHO2_02_FULL_39_17]|uniref:DUF4238 domain-containing protein n=1 Tax=Candidatus Buchananbacteria bacterium RIFCSPLOWO2_01_FULL_40_23b TaxID=1797544 RepID=A0A1G1YW15_9BACT|nr:MAG: hypothetical protein A3D39_00470 [Candidatus Buchananbacteria bacterium RIFCSPHIGHO2_02_FULL_39_17]OGY55587.1 MAG: hypothetical protein A2912_01580 [Candidatus Buchananbacteria bacterium RIFCSPLOWO2_01_FULL_40_23b]
MARPNKKQHKIPRTYLQAFSNQDGLVWVGDERLKIFQQKPSNILTENDYYTIRFPTGGGTLEIETKLLNGIEGSYSDIYRQKIRNIRVLNLEEKAKMAIFVASMMERQSMLRDALTDFINRLEKRIKHMQNLPNSVKKQMANFTIPSKEKGVPAKDLLKLGKDVGSLHSSLIPKLLPDLATIIFNMKWGFVLRNKQSYPFITSDNPCVMMNPATEIRYGKGTIGSAPGLIQKDVEITLPLSSDIALICGWLLETDCLYTPIDKKLVDNINFRTRRHARTIIGSDQKMLFEIAKRILKIKRI